MGKRNDASKLQTSATPKSQPEELHNAAMNRKAAEAELPEGPVKGQTKRAGGFNRDN